MPYPAAKGALRRRPPQGIPRAGAPAEPAEAPYPGWNRAGILHRQENGRGRDRWARSLDAAGEPVRSASGDPERRSRSMRPLANGDRLLPVLEVPADVPDDTGRDRGPDQQIEFVEIFPQDRPPLPHHHSDVGKAQAPGKGPRERVGDEPFHLHPRDPGGESDEGADDRQEAREEDGGLAVPLEPAVRHVQGVPGHEDILPPLLDERPASVHPQVVRRDRANDASDRP